MAKKYTADTFEGAVTGTASGNVAKAGDAMTGKLNINYQDAEIEIRNNNFSGSRSKLAFGTTMSGDQASVQLNNSSSNLEFRRGPQSSAPKMTIQSSAVYFSSPLRIGADAAANELDDYEEGTWTPAIYNSSGSSLSYGSQQGKYVKVGRQVFFKLYIHVSNISYMSTSGVLYGTLPFQNIDTSPAGIADFFPAMNNLTPFNSAANNQHAYKIKCWLTGQTYSTQYKFLLPPTSPTAGTSTAAAALGTLMQNGNFSFFITGSFYTTA